MKGIESKSIDNTIYQYDPRILYFEKNRNNIRLTFITEPGIYHHKYIPKLRIDSGMRPVPGLLWNFETDYKNESLNLKAFIKYEGPDTQYYRAPFLNTSSSVCLGSSEFDENTFYKGNATDITNSVIKAFFNSAFTHASTVKQVNGNIISLSKNLLGMTEFPQDVLIPIPKKEKNEDD